MNHQEAKKYLAAFADGELDVDQNLQMLEQLKMDPQATARVEHQQQLREVVKQSMTNQTPQLPQALRQTLTNMIDEAETTSNVDSQDFAQPHHPRQPLSMPPSHHRSVAGRLGWRLGLSFAAVLAIGASIWLTMKPAPSPIFVSGNTMNLMPISQAQQMTKRHLNCSQMIEKLMDFNRGPVTLEQMPNLIQEQLGSQSYPTLDLSGIGYQFLKAGPCTLPGNKAAHLIYQAAPHTGRHDAISLWITADNGSMKIASDVVYGIRGKEYAHPIMIWRHGGLLYYLVGDSYPDMKQVYLTLAGNW